MEKFQFSWVSDSKFVIFPQLFLCIAQDLRHKAPKSCEYTREFDYTPVAYTWQFWTQGNRTVHTAHCALMYHIYHGNDNTFNNRQTGGYFFRFSLSPRPSSATILALNQFSMINAIQGKLNSTRQCNAILGRGNFCFFSFCFQLLSCRHCVESRGESALVTDSTSLWLTGTTANKDQEQQETQLSFAAGRRHQWKWETKMMWAIVEKQRPRSSGVQRSPSRGLSGA